jgi:hypothetical protein
MLGFLIDENEFEVSPAVSRVLQVTEVDTRTTRRRKKMESIEQSNNFNLIYNVGNDTLSQTFNYTTNLSILDIVNVNTYDVYINNDYYGTNVSQVQINTNDIVRIEVVRLNVSEVSSMVLSGFLL